MARATLNFSVNAVGSHSVEQSEDRKKNFQSRGHDEKNGFKNNHIEAKVIVDKSLSLH